MSRKKGVITLKEMGGVRAERSFTKVMTSGKSEVKRGGEEFKEGGKIIHQKGKAKAEGRVSKITWNSSKGKQSLS